MRAVDRFHKRETPRPLLGIVLKDDGASADFARAQPPLLYFLVDRCSPDTETPTEHFNAESPRVL
jgi:hypothetical protein